MKILGISGRRGSGKTTLIQGLRSRGPGWGLRVDVYHPANMSRTYLTQQFDLDYEALYSEKHRLLDIRLPGHHHNGPVSGAELMFFWARLIRQMDPLAPIRGVLKQITDHHDAFPTGILYLIDGIRYPNEVQAIHEARGMVLRLDRHPYDLLDESETALDRFGPQDFDLWVPGNKTQEETQEMVVQFLKDRRYLPGQEGTQGECE